jgi:3-deoxy-D-manno-octulosonate 8-phosphate phosphatase (KDO 8-P phosphatase)
VRPPIRLLVLDVDGVLTDGRLWFGATGEAFKVFHVRDGLGLKQLLAAGIEVAVVSGRRSPAVAARCAELGIRHLHEGCTDKVVALQALLGATGIPAEETACIVDDTTDLELMAAVGFAAAVADAHPEVRSRAHAVMQARGGEGAVREFCDLLLDRAS